MQNKRHIIYVHKQYQRGFILKFSYLALGSMVLAGLVLYFLSKSSITAAYRYHHLSLVTTAEAILPSIIITNLVVFLCFLAATVYVTLYVSHKVGGPLYRFGKGLRAIGEGDLRLRIRLRGQDQLKEFEQQINEMAESLEERVRVIKKEVAGLKAEVESGECERECIKQRVERLEETVSRLFETD